jgi:hypothetical protein
MALPFKPHTATRSAAADSVDTDSAVKGVTRSGSTTVTGHLVWLSAVQAAEQFGSFTVCTAKWLQDVGALALAVNDYITVGGVVFAVKTDKILHSTGLPNDYESYGLQKVDA